MKVLVVGLGKSGLAACRILLRRGDFVVATDSNPTSEYGPSSQHAGGAYHLLADGSVRFITDTINERVYAALATPAGQDAIDSF